MKKEAKFSKEVVDYLEAKGAVVNVNTASIYDRVGRADVEACYLGYYIALELKTPPSTRMHINSLAPVLSATLR